MSEAQESITTPPSATTSINTTAGSVASSANTTPKLPPHNTKNINNQYSLEVKWKAICHLETGLYCIILVRVLV